MYSEYRSKTLGRDGPTLNLTDSASLKGLTERIKDGDKDVYSFKGIPYAEAPVGDLRFKRPVAKTLWKGERLAQSGGPKCPQAPTEEIMHPNVVPFAMDPLGEMSEDCLNLDVYTPTLDENEKLPVMVYIHGGGYMIGAKDLLCGGLSQCTFQRVVCVGLNYRLHALGFSGTADGAIPPNLGLWDQVEGLKWVQKYIRKFGGNPDNVTIYGESAGAISVSMLILSKQTKGLFHKAISQSGTCFMPGYFYTKEQHQQKQDKFLQQLGYKGSSSKELLDFLNTTPIDTIVPLVHLSDNEAYRPVFDGEFFHSSILDAYSSGDFNQVPYICGNNVHEGLIVAYFMAMWIGTEIKTKANVKAVVDKCLEHSGVDYSDDNINKLVDLYCKHTADTPDGYFEAAAELTGDFIFEKPGYDVINFHSEKADVYQYLFDYRPSAASKTMYPSWAKADHGWDEPFVHGCPFLDDPNDLYSEDDKTVSRIFMEYFATFAETGVPSYKGKPWPKYNTKREYMINKPQPCVETELKKEKMQFWTNNM